MRFGPVHAAYAGLARFSLPLVFRWAEGWGDRREATVEAGAPSASPLQAFIDFHHRVSAERLLAGARLVTGLAVFASIASNVGAMHPSAVKVLTGVYALYAAGILLAVRTRPRRLLHATNRLHYLDLVWATAASALSGGASSHVFPLFALILVGAAYRWGLRRTLLEGGLVVIIALALSVPAVMGITPWPFEFDWFVLWVAYIAVLAVLFGLLSERMHALSFQRVALGQVMTNVGRATGLASAIDYTLREALRLFGARNALLAIEEADSTRLFLWRAQTQAGGLVTVVHRELPQEDKKVWLFDLPPSISGFEARRPHGGPDPAGLVLSLDADGHVIDLPFTLPASIVHNSPWQSLIAVVVDLQGWRGRVYLLEPTSTPGGALRLGFLQNLACQVAPLLLDLYLLRGLRSRVESRQRARIARELHDGVIQGLAGLEMRLDVLRRQTDGIAPALTSELTQIRNLLHVEQIDLRELMHQLRPIDVDARRLPCELGDLAERFSRGTGLDVRLEWAVNTLDLAPYQCREVVRIVQEALVNARRHAAASRVLVRVESDASDWALIVEDNGRGFGFTGRLTHEELEAQQKGPRVIRDRVTALHGALTVESTIHGARLEMTFPHGRHD